MARPTDWLQKKNVKKFFKTKVQLFHIPLSSPGFVDGGGWLVQKQIEGNSNWYLIPQWPVSTLHVLCTDLA